MKSLFIRIFSRLVFASALVLLSLHGRAQSTGLLYDPEPPVDSAYVRVIVASRDGAVDILVDGRPRIQKLKAGEASEYMVLKVGKHTVALHPVGKTTAYLTTTLDVVQGRAITAAFPSLRADAAPIIFDDKANSNKLKALLAVYHLAAKAGPLDILTADGKTHVFSGVTYGTPASIQVNPISVELIATTGADKVARGRASLTMTQGGTYSVFLLSGEGEKLATRVVQNKIERYTGK